MIRELAADIKFEHSVFALPFAYLGMVLAASARSGGGLPSLAQVVWVTVAMVTARTLAMAANRLIDREIDARNPRTARRALPAGRLSSRQVLAACLVSGIVFLFAASQLNTTCLVLAPVAAAIVIGYSYTKRFTPYSHLALGIADAVAPVGGWLAITGQIDPPALVLALAVASWIGGFDVIYACQDVDFDRANGLHSFPADFGIATGLRISITMHVVTVLALVWLAPMLGLGIIYLAGVAIAAGLLAYEHWIIRPDDLSRLGAAFFSVNGYIAVIIFLFTCAALAFRS